MIKETKRVYDFLSLITPFIKSSFFFFILTGRSEELQLLGRRKILSVEIFEEELQLLTENDYRIVYNEIKNFIEKKDLKFFFICNFLFVKFGKKKFKIIN
jgi:hypothetical protein